MKEKITIYVLKDPITGTARYVGRTVNKLDRRLYEHIRAARTGKLKDKRKEEWIRSLLADGLKPIIEAIEEVDRKTFQVIEQKWIALYRQENPDLLNLKRGGDGGLGGHFIKWTPEFDTLLGKIGDSRIAEMLNVSRKSVTYRREKLGIPAAYDRTRNTPPPNMAGINKKHIAEEHIRLLGTMPDHELGKLSNTNKKRIGLERRKRGISPYAETTGNHGRFGLRKKPRKIELDDPRLKILGAIQDAVAADILGLSHSRVCAIRKLLGIKSYHSTLAKQ